MAEQNQDLKPDDIPDVQTVQRIAAETAATLAAQAAAEQRKEADRQKIKDAIDRELVKDPVLAADAESRELVKGEVWNRLKGDPANRTLSDAEFWKKVSAESEAALKREEERSAKRSALKAAGAAAATSEGRAAAGEGERGASEETRSRSLASSTDEDGEPQFGPGTDWSKTSAQIEAERARAADKFLRQSRKQAV